MNLPSDETLDQSFMPFSKIYLQDSIISSVTKGDKFKNRCRAFSILLAGLPKLFNASMPTDKTQQLDFRTSAYLSFIVSEYWRTVEELSEQSPSIAIRSLSEDYFWPSQSELLTNTAVTNAVEVFCFVKFDISYLTATDIVAGQNYQDCIKEREIK